MSVAVSKNSVVVGFVAYFVGLSLMGLLIYRWSQPHVGGASLPAASAVRGHSGAPKVVVEYENLAGEEAEVPVQDPEALTDAPVEAAPELAPEVAAPAADASEEWK